jgi:hypothetical protein
MKTDAGTVRYYHWDAKKCCIRCGSPNPNYAIFLEMETMERKHNAAHTT